MLPPNNETLKTVQEEWILEKSGRNFRQYFNARNPLQHKTIITKGKGDPIQTWRVGQSSDDCRKAWNGSSWSFSLTAGQQPVGFFEYTWYKMGGGMRFTNVGIPQGAVITSAYMKVCACQDNAQTGVRSRIRGEAADNPATFSTLADFDARTRTSASVDWDDIPAWTMNSWYSSPDIAAVIQEIVSRTGWASGNALVLFWDDFDDRSSKVYSNLRYGFSFDGKASDVVKLEILWVGTPNQKEWKVSASSDDCRVQRKIADHTVLVFSTTESYTWVGRGGDIYEQGAMRFLGIDIPQGSTINSAKIRICPYDLNANTVCNAKLTGQNSDDTAAFSDVADYDARPRTSAQVNWNNVPAWSDYSWKESPDIASIIQEIVSRPGWASGNSMVIFLEDNVSSLYAERQYCSYDYRSDRAPELVIVWTAPIPPAAGGAGSNMGAVMGLIS